MVMLYLEMYLPVDAVLRLLVRDGVIPSTFRAYADRQTSIDLTR